MTTQIRLNSEIGKLDAVMVHRPGQEIENMTPASAAQMLYDDILSLPLAFKEHSKMVGVLQRVSRVVEFKDLLQDVLDIDKIKQALLSEICDLYNCREILDELLDTPNDTLSGQLFEGTPMNKDTLEKYLSPLRHTIPPLSNAFFTRDATMCVNNRVIIGSMAHKTRFAESLLLKAIFKYHPDVDSAGFYFDGTTRPEQELSIEGGDLLVLRDDLALIGYSERTNPAGIDVLMKSMASQGRVANFIVAEIPKQRASIHLDMIFTMLDRDKCMIFPPAITGVNRSRAYHIAFKGDEVKRIVEYPGILEALRTQGMDLTPIRCGGKDPLRQEREQWQSGANFFTFAPGHILGFEHNFATLDELSRHGFEVLKAEDVISDKVTLDMKKPTVVTIDGSELSRGGGGCRCMTMPISRQPVDW